MTKHNDWSGQRELRSVVQTVRRRWRTRQALRGLLLTAASGFIALLVVSFAVDRWFTSPTAATVFAALLYTGVAGVALFTLVRPLVRRVTDRQVAHYLEEHEPSLRAEILTAVSVLEEENDEQTHELLSGLMRSAVLRAREVEGGRRVDRDSLKRLSWSTAGMSAVLAVILLADPMGLRRAVPDLVRPWTAVEAAPTLAIQVLPGDTVVPRGAELRITARLQGFGAENVELAVRESEEPGWDRWPMAIEDSDAGDHEVVLFRVDAPMEYYAEAEGIRSGTHRIEVVDLPYVGQLGLELHHPAYTGLDPEIIESGGDFVALPGTRVVVRADPTIPVPGGRIVFEEAANAELTPGSDGALTGEFTVEESGFYHLELEDEEGAHHRGTRDHLIDMVEDLRPIVSLEQPARDVRVTSIEEVFVETQATDDYGIGALELIFSVNGGDEQTVSLMDGGASSLREVSAGHTFFLEDYDLQPGDLVAYHVRALDNGPNSGDRETRTDMFFIEVRPFSQDFRQAEQGGGGGGGGGGQQGDPMAGQFSERQREIVTATFNVGRDWRQIAPEILEADIATIAQAQASLRDEVNSFLDELRRRLARAPEEMQQVAEMLPEAAEAMEEALGELEEGETADALPAEQRALQHLLRAEAVFREIQLTQQQGGGGGGASGAEAREDLADFFDLEMDRMRNQYEELQQGERQEQDQQLDQAMERLRELARRQQQEEERLQRAAERAPQGAAGAGGESQRRLAEETEELARELERLSREQSSPQLAETARQLQAAAEAMRRSAATRDQSGIRQSGDAQAALEEARRLLERDRDNRLNQNARQAADRAQRALDRQRDIQDAVENLPQDAQGRSEALPSVLEQKDQLTEDLEQLQEDLNRMAEEAGDPQTERAFREAASAIRDDQLPDRIGFSRNLVRSGQPEQAREFEQQITDLMEDLNDRVESAANAAEGNAGNGPSELTERTRQLVRAAESMEQRAQQAAGQQSGQAGQGDQQGQQGDQQGQQGDQQGQQGDQQGQQGGQQGQQGGQAGGAQASGAGNPQGFGGGRSGGFDGDMERQLRREAGERRAQAEELRDELRASGAPEGSLETLDGVIDRFRDLEGSGIYNEPRALADLQRELVERLRELDFDVRRHFATGDGDGPMVAGSGEVPEAYREMVEEYFRSLARP